MQCPRQLDSVGCGYYVQKYIHEIVHISCTPITSLVSFYFHFLYVTNYINYLNLVFYMLNSIARNSISLPLDVWKCMLVL